MDTQSMNKTNFAYVLLIAILLTINLITIYFMLGNKVGRFSFQYIPTNNHVLIGNTESGKSWLCLTSQAFEEEAQENALYEASKKIKPLGDKPLSDEEFEARIKAIESDNTQQEVLELDYSKGCLEVIKPKDTKEESTSLIR